MRRVAYAGADDVTSAGVERWEALLREARRAGLTIASRFHGEFNIASGAQAASELLAAGPLPEAVIAGSDLNAVGVIARLRESGVRVPEDVLVTGFDDTELSRFYEPSITTVVQPITGIARDAVACLLGRMSEPGDAVRTSRIVPTLRIGRSTAR